MAAGGGVRRDATVRFAAGSFALKMMASLNSVSNRSGFLTLISPSSTGMFAKMNLTDGSSMATGSTLANHLRADAPIASRRRRTISLMAFCGSFLIHGPATTRSQRARPFARMNTENSAKRISWILDDSWKISAVSAMGSNPGLAVSATRRLRHPEGPLSRRWAGLQGVGPRNRALRPRAVHADDHRATLVAITRRWRSNRALPTARFLAAAYRATPVGLPSVHPAALRVSQPADRLMYRSPTLEPGTPTPRPPTASRAESLDRSRPRSATSACRPQDQERRR